MALLKRILSAGEGKKLKEYERVVAAVSALEPAIHPLSDEALRAKTGEFRARLAAGETL